MKLVTPDGQIENVAVLGPEREQIQVELSRTDCWALKLCAPVRLSGHLDGAGDLLMVGPVGVLEAKGCAIVARAHIHMAPEDAARLEVRDGESLRVRLETARPLALEQVIVRIKEGSKLAMHIDQDEANAALRTVKPKATS